MDEYYSLDPINFELYNFNKIYECTGIDYLAGENGLIGVESLYNWSITSDGIEKWVIPFLKPGSIFPYYIDNNYCCQIRAMFILLWMVKVRFCDLYEFYHVLMFMENY